jgi:ABC-type Fe3+ transport system permease subunit
MLNVTIWVAAHSMRELSAALMLRTSKSVVISTLIWEFWAEDSETTGAAVLGIVMIVILLLLTVVGIVVFERTLTVRSSKRKRLDGSSPRDDGRDDRVAGLHSNKEG